MHETVLGRYRRSQPAVLAAEAGLLAALLGAWALLSPAGLTATDWQGLLSAAIPVAITAMAQTFPIVAGGQGLSAGATLLLVTAVVAHVPVASGGDAIRAILYGLGCGVGIGAFNGVLTGFFRLRSTPVTLAAGAAAAAFALQFAGEEYAPAQDALTAMLLGWRVAGIAVPPLLAVLGFCGVATALLAGRHGRALRLVGAGGEHPQRHWLVFAAYAGAGLGAALGGIFLAASYGSVNVALGAPVLLQILAAVALGGSIPGLRGGSAVGSLLGAGIVVATGNLFIPLDLPDFLSTAFDAGWLLLGFLICAAAQGAPPLPASGPHRAAPRAVTLLCLLAPLGLLAANWFPESADLATMAAGLILLAAGQTASLRGGMVDLAMPGLIGAGAIGTVALTGGANATLPLVLGALALAAAAIGAVHGWIAARAGRAAIAVSLATAGLAQAVSAGCLVLLPTGYAPSRLTAAVSARWLGVSPVGWLLAGLAVAIAFGMDRAGRRLGRSGVAMLGAGASALAALAFGVMLAGYAGTAHFSLVDSYFLPTIAAALLTNCRVDRPGASVSRAIPIAMAMVMIDTFMLTQGAGYAGRVAAVAAVLVAGEALHAAQDRRAARQASARRCIA